MHLGWLKQLSSQEDQEDLISAMWHTKLSPVLPQFLGAAECFLSTAVDALHCLPCSGDEPCKYRSKVSRLETNVKSLRFTMIYPTKSDKLHATLPNLCNSRWRPQAGQRSMTSMKTFLLLEGEETGRQPVQSADVACFASLDAMVAGAFITASSKAWWSSRTLQP